jgi:sporulation initiation inhibitor protein Soj
MTKIISVSNNKGGSGKTTLTSNLGYALSTLGKKILLIDADMQMNLTRSYDIAPDKDTNLYKALSEEKSLINFIKKTQYNNIDIIVSDYMLSAIDMQLVNKNFKETLVKRLLEDIVSKEIYDYILIDTCPFLGLLNYNVLVASDYVLIPVELSAFGIEGLEPLSNFIKEVKLYNKSLEILGIVETKVDNRESTTRETRELLRDLFSSKIFENNIPVDINIKKSQFQGMPICEFDKNSRASISYNSLAVEVLEKTSN